MEEKKILKASEARAIADAGDVVLRRIYKAIGTMAKEGVTVLRWIIDNFSSKCIERITNSLVSNGYEVYVDTHDDDEDFNELVIKW